MSLWLLPVDKLKYKDNVKRFTINKHTITQLEYLPVIVLQLHSKNAAFIAHCQDF